MLAIRYCRLKRGWSQETLARLVRTRQASICRIEQGRLRPGDKLLDDLAGVLGVSPAFTLLKPVVVQQTAHIQGSVAEPSA